MKPNQADFIEEISIKDPDSKLDVAMSVFKHAQSGGIFGVDSSFIIEVLPEDGDISIADPFNEGQSVLLRGA